MTAVSAYPWEAAPSGASAALAGAMQAMLPRLETARLVLRAPVIGDFEPYGEILMSERAVYMDGPLDRRESWLDFVQCVANWPLRGHGLFTIVAKSDGRVLGFINLTMQYGDREPELGWFLLPDAEGKGFAFEAAQAMRDWGLREIELASLVSYIDRANTRSIRLAEKLGGTPDEAASVALGQGDGVVVYRHWPPMGDDEGGMEAYA